MTPYAQKISDILQGARISADFIAEDGAAEDGAVTFRAESLLLKFTHHGSEEYLELSCALAPGQFYWFGDVEVAMGWGSLENILSRTALPPIQDVVNRLAQHVVELKKIFFKNLELFTQASIQRTMRHGTPQIKQSPLTAARRGSSSSATDAGR